MTRVLLLAPYPLRTTPSQRFRFEQYIEPLRTLGIDCEVRPLLDPETVKILYRPGYLARKAGVVLRGALARLRDLASARSFDAVFVHREAYPLGYPLVERLLGVLGLPYLFDFDDAIYLSNASAANRFIAPLKFAQKTAVIAKHAALVIAGNQHLAQWARQFNQNVQVIPTTIDTQRYAPVPRRREGPLCLGWSGSVTTIEHLRPLSPVLRRLQQQHGVRLRVIGDPSFSIEGASVEALSWSEDREVDDLSQLDIGVMPLPDEEWARGKCGLKALQYMGLGIPTVMSPVGVNSEIASGGAAQLASTEAEWESILTGLLRDETARLALGKAGRQRVIERYSIEANLPAYAEAIRRVARGAR
jgi:glycosyltransferase involved in cell wall biosynthesis